MRFIIPTLITVTLSAQALLHHPPRRNLGVPLIINNNGSEPLSPYTHCHECMPLMCGKTRVPYGFQPRVYGGIQSSRGRQPWVAMILNGNQLIGGGALISCNLVLTTAFNVKQVPHISRLRVRVGSVDLQNSADTEVEFKVKKVHISPKWNPALSLYEGDIALIQLDGAVDFQEANGFINPICLPRSDRDYEGWLTVAGFGHNIQGTNKGELREADILKLEPKQCNLSVATRNTFCGLGKNRGLCTGDRGNPAVQRDTNGRYTLAGIANDYQCTEGAPDVYTKIPQHVNWICSVKVL